jgi:hypothetical protein
VRVLDFGVEGRTPFLVMDYAPHGTLRQRHLEGTQVRAALEKGTLRYAIGGLIIALMGILFLAQSSGQFLIVGWVVGGMAVLIGCVIFIAALLL